MIWLQAMNLGGFLTALIWAELRWRRFRCLRRFQGSRKLKKWTIAVRKLSPIFQKSQETTEINTPAWAGCHLHARSKCEVVPAKEGILAKPCPSRWCYLPKLQTEAWRQLIWRKLLFSRQPHCRPAALGRALFQWKKKQIPRSGVSVVRPQVVHGFYDR